MQPLTEWLRAGPLSREQLLAFGRAFAHWLADRHALEEYEGGLSAQTLLWDGASTCDVVAPPPPEELEAAGALPPECLDDDAPRLARTARAEVWQAGVVLYQAATGEHPFADEDPEDRRAAIRHEHPALPGHLRPEIPLEWDPIVSCCLHKRPEERFADALDLANEIEGLAASGGTKRRAPRELSWRRVALVLALLALGIVLFATREWFRWLAG